MAQDPLTSVEARWGDGAARAPAEEEAERSLGEAEDRDPGARDLPRGQVCWGDPDSAAKGEGAGDVEEGAGRHQGDLFSETSAHLHDQDCPCVGEDHEVCAVDWEEAPEIVEVRERNSSVVFVVVTELGVWWFQQNHQHLQPCHKAS